MSYKVVLFVHRDFLAGHQVSPVEDRVVLAAQTGNLVGNWGSLVEDRTGRVAQPEYKKDHYQPKVAPNRVALGRRIAVAHMGLASITAGSE